MIGVRGRPVKSWSVPKFDHKDPSLGLYLPLWYPYSDMTGSTIYSYDRNRHSCTATTPTWGVQGRYADGNDIINCGERLSAISTITILAWIKFPAIAGTKFIFGENEGTKEVCQLSHTDAEGVKFVVTTSGVDTGAISILGNTDDNTWHFVSMTYNGTTLSGRVDLGAAVTDTCDGNINHQAGIDFCLFARDFIASPLYSTGYIGELAYYTRVLSLGEMARYRDTTQWRYK